MESQFIAKADEVFFTISFIAKGLNSFEATEQDIDLRNKAARGVEIIKQNRRLRMCQMPVSAIGGGVSHVVFSAHPRRTRS